MPSNDFPHLLFSGVVEGPAELIGGGSKPQKQRDLESDRPSHHKYLSEQLGKLNAWWAEQKEDRRSKGLPIPEGTALWVKIDEESPDLDFLRTSFGLELVAEEDGGFILVSANDDAYSITAEKLEKFLNEEHGGGSAAKIYELSDKEDEGERLKRILPSSFFEAWREIKDTDQVTADFGISCNAIKIPEIRSQKKDELEEQYTAYLESARQRIEGAQQELDNLIWKRQEEFQKNWISPYGRVESCIEGFADSFTIRATVSGIGFKDIVANYSFLFQV
ncbi:MAG: hypothetical protein WC334_10560, partial [Kiritimatiellales bacterium]